MIEPSGPTLDALPGYRERTLLPRIPVRRRPSGARQRLRGQRRPEPLPRSGALRPLRSHRQQRTFLHWHVRGRFRLLSPAGGLSLVLALAPAAAVPRPAGGGGGPERALEGVGRWERPLQRCRLERRQPPGAAAAGCRGLRLDQQLPGLLSLRLLGAELQRGGSPGQLVFAGVLEPGSRPLGCRQLRCRPEGPLLLQVSAMARSSIPQDPGGSALLQAQRAEGRCRLEGQKLSCRVRGDDGEDWEVEADL